MCISGEMREQKVFLDAVYYSNDFPWSQEVENFLGLGWPPEEYKFCENFYALTQNFSQIGSLEPN